jgi:hypothetical protein
VPAALPVAVPAPVAHLGQLQRATEAGRWGRHAPRGGGGAAASHFEAALVPRGRVGVGRGGRGDVGATTKPWAARGVGCAGGGGSAAVWGRRRHSGR